MRLIGKSLPNEGWRDAFLYQAISDFRCAELLLRSPGCGSQATMLLQMSWEKLAKAHAGFWDPARKKSHAAAGTFVSVLKRQRFADNEFVWKRNYGNALTCCATI